MDLTEIGLTGNEAKAYEALLRLGSATAAQVSKEARVPYGRIYDVLASLEEKGLVKSIPEKTRKYVPSDPEGLRSYVQKKKQRFDEIEKQLATFKSLYAQHAEAGVQVVKGERNFKKLALSMKKPKKREYSVKYVFRTDPEFLREFSVRKKKGIDYRVLGRVDKETAKNIRVWEKKGAKIKPIPNRGVAMSIVDGEEMLLALANSNMIFLIKDKPFIEFMERLFLCYYENN